MITHTIIKKGNPEAKWWIGLDCECPTCGQIVKLQKDAEHAAEFCRWSPDEIRWNCENCRISIPIKKGAKK